MPPRFIPLSPPRRVVSRQFIRTFTRQSVCLSRASSSLSPRGPHTNQRGIVMNGHNLLSMMQHTIVASAISDGSRKSPHIEGSIDSLPFADDHEDPAELAISLRRVWVVNTTSALHAPVATALSAAVNLTTADPAGTCDNLNTCRSLFSIVQTCLATIFACVWVAVHRNIPAPKIKPHYSSNPVKKAAQWLWSKICDQRQSVIVFTVTLLAPEWVLAWAIRQELRARKLVKELNKARTISMRRCEARHPEYVKKQGVETAEGADTRSTGISMRGSSEDGLPLIEKTSPSNAMVTQTTITDHAAEQGAETADDEDIQITGGSLPSSAHDELSPTEKRIVSSPISITHPTPPTPQEDEIEWTRARRVGQLDQAWTVAHAFFIIAGGYHGCNENGPQYPLDPEDVVSLVRDGKLVPPTTEALSDRSKGDVLSKGIAILQTVWFVVQCIARLAEHLPITNLEVMTLAYTVMTVAMYIAWWDKPLNVSCAIRVPVDRERWKFDDSDFIDFGRIAKYVMGVQDDDVYLRTLRRVPTFWAGVPDQDDVFKADVIALLVAMAFGAVHCIAWFYPFTSHAELLLWRMSAIAIIAFPAGLL
ncbi:hypothetical protein HWV62_23196 [Athelia sp. TMB]|nr:hypothetical protein HWV62_23196 [Athelia sp. TMB]